MLVAKVLTGAAALLVAGSSALLASRYVPFDVLPVPPDTWAMITAFTDFAAPASLLAALAAGGAVALRRGPARVVLASVCVLAAGGQVLLAAPRWVAAPPLASSRSFTVLALNSRLGQADPVALVEAARTADVLVLTEVTAPQVRALTAAGLEARFPYRNVGRLPPAGAGGTAVLSRFPITGSERLSERLANESWVCRVALPGASEPLTVVAVHPGRPRAGGTSWLSEQEDLRSALPTSGLRLLAGDFNAVASHPTQRALVRDGWTSAVDQAGAGWVPTYPAGSRVPPLIDIDHVYLTQGLQARSVRSVAVPGTDHLGLLVTVDETTRS